MTVHSDSTSAIARAVHTAARPGQNVARNIQNMVCSLRNRGKTVDLVWVKGHEGTPGNKKADGLAGKAGYSRVMSIAHLKLRIAEKFRSAKEAWAQGSESSRDRGDPKKSCLDSMRNALARTTA
jgi:hypothetical protein